MLSTSGDTHLGGDDFDKVTVLSDILIIRRERLKLRYLS